MPVRAIENVSNEVAAGHINKYFEVRTDGRPKYTGSKFETFAGGGDIVDPNRITSADLIAVSMLSVHVPGEAALGITGEFAGEIEELLAQVPTELRLEDLTEDEFVTYLDDGSPAGRIWALLRQRGNRWGVGQTTTSKILARKRPHLVPIYDSVIAGLVGMRDSRSQWRCWWEAFQGDEGRKLIERLAVIRAASGQTHLSLLRVLDIVLWMEGRGAEEIRETVGDEE